MAIKVLVRSKGTGRNCLLYYVDPATGREVSRSAGTAERRQAERAAARWEAELLSIRGADDTGWEWFVERFENEHLAALPKKTRKAYVTALNHFRRLINVGAVSEVTAGTISTFQAKLLQENRPLTTIGTYLTHIRAALNWGERVGMLAKAPKVAIPKVGRRKLMRGRPVTHDEYSRIRLAAQEDPELQRFIDLLWLSGLRLTEACRLSWDSAPLMVQVDARPYPQIVFLAEGHKAAEDDVTPITPDLLSWLLQTPTEARSGRVAPLHTSTGTFRLPDKVGVRISELGEACGILVNDKGKFASAHDFRRAFGTRWAKSVRPITLQRLMRHKSITTTLRYYVGLDVADAGAELWPSGVQRVPSGVPKADPDWAGIG